VSEDIKQSGPRSLWDLSDLHYILSTDKSWPQSFNGEQTSRRGSQAWLIILDWLSVLLSIDKIGNPVRCNLWRSCSRSDRLGILISGQETRIVFYSAVRTTSWLWAHHVLIVECPRLRIARIFVIITQHSIVGRPIFSSLESPQEVWDCPLFIIVSCACVSQDGYWFHSQHVFNRVYMPGSYQTTPYRSAKLLFEG
jgi:hypothetical protein